MVYMDVNENPYDSSTQDLEPQTLPMDEVIRLAIQSATMSLRVMLPAVVLAVDSPGTVDVQPTLKSRYIDGTLKDLPAIKMVPVSMIQGAGYSIKVPVAVGDTGYLVFCDRSLDAWLAGSGGIVDPQDSRQHYIADAVFVPGLVTFSNQVTDSTTDLVITNGTSVIRLESAGKFKVTNGTNELLDLLSQITDQLHTLSETLSTDTVNTVFGPQQLLNFSTYQTVATQLEELKSKLDTLKG